jgi:uncharacterized protein YecE (DUF72 family)
MKLHIGTSGFGYKEWKGKFFPGNIKPAEMLKFYAARFGAVEINNSFYSLPKAAVLEGWLKEVPQTFIFGFKAPQKITHILRLKPETAAVLEAFLKAIDVVGSQLGPLLFQLPPNFKLDLGRFQEFLALIPSRYKVTFEFRNASWLTPEVFAALRARNAALCVAQAEDTIEIPLEATADWGYLRLRRLDYSSADLKGWAERIRAQKWKEAFVFFKHEELALGPKFAAEFGELLS